jgi:hypothetical protein
MDPNQLIAAVAERQLGPDPAAAQAQPQPGQMPGQPPAPPPAQPAPEKDTAQDVASAAGAPNDASNKMSSDPVIYEIEMADGKKRKMTPEQIRGTMDRYSNLNYQHAQMKPVLEIVERMIEANPGAKPEDVAAYMMSMLQGGQKNAQMGGKDERPNNQTPPDVDPLAKWEEDNAASLPPGYREMMQGSGSIQQELASVKQMLQQVLQASAGVADAARVGNQDAQQQRISSIQQNIANNIDRAQAQLQLPDDAANDFMMFAAERGYTLEDFIDPRLTVQVMQDFKNNVNSPEFERLAAINQKRQAWTGGPMPSAPAAPGGPPQEGTGNAMFDGLTKSALTKRFPGE